MESLLCNEVWLLNEVHEYYNVNGIHNCHTSPLYSNREDIEQAFISFLEKEVSYMPERVCVKHVKENGLMGSGRSKAIRWFVKSQRRLSLSLETVFGAVNYLDRFSSLRNCQVWNDRIMFELVSVACLSIASKSYETDPPNLNQIQMEGLEHSFESSLILRMELILLKALDWRLFPTTSYSYIELLKWSIESLNKHLVHEFTALISELLVKALLDPSFSEFRSCVIALSALDLVSKEFLPTMNDSLCKHFSALIPPDQKDDLIKCCKMMMMMDEKIVEQCNIAPAKKACINCPSSPVTVLATHYCCNDFSDCQVDLSLLTMKNADFNYFGGSRKKRKKEQEGCCGV
ncbi:hypothetical protein ACH5RR_004882 [Cinchona calisaya]|uniref:Cyclin-like domain-containing protein n=1 Tax=Cinchona calisaya TaxID=153742 RepID=A0ABD3AZA0_9GENT